MFELREMTFALNAVDNAFYAIKGNNSMFDLREMTFALKAVDID